MGTYDDGEQSRKEKAPVAVANLVDAKKDEGNDVGDIAKVHDSLVGGFV